MSGVSADSSSDSRKRSPVVSGSGLGNLRHRPVTRGEPQDVNQESTMRIRYHKIQEDGGKMMPS